MPARASVLGYAGGFALATALLHIVGIGLSVGIEKIAPAKFVRFAGGIIAPVWYWSVGQLKPFDDLR
jgi:hydrogenase/urease accessory protein HupE